MVGTQSSCITSSSLVSNAAFFVSIFTQLDDSKKLRKWILPPCFSSCPLQTVSSSRLNRSKPNSCAKFREKKLSKCILWGVFNPDHINWQSSEFPDPCVYLYSTNQRRRHIPSLPQLIWNPYTFSSIFLTTKKNRYKKSKLLFKNWIEYELQSVRGSEA